MSINWADTSVLLTGGNGFLGSATQKVLTNKGAKSVVAPSSDDYDLRLLDPVRSMIEDHRPDVIIHMAAKVGGIGANMERPADLYLDNLMMGTHVLEQARLAGVQKTVMIGTICSYPKHTPVPFQESSLWTGYPEETNAPYGIAKLAQLVQMQANRAQYGQSAIYLMPTNLYGPGDKFNPGVSHVIPALIRKCVMAKEAGDDFIEVWGTGSASREFLYVDDAAEGICAATELYDGEEPINLGTNEERPIKELVELIADACGFEGEIRWDSSKPDGQPRRRVDPSAAEAEFGWTAKTRFAEGLKKTVDWFVANRAEAEARDS